MNNNDLNEFALGIQGMMQTIATEMPLLKAIYDNALDIGFDENKSMQLAIEEFKILHGVYALPSDDSEND